MLYSSLATEVYAGTVSEFLSSLKTLGNSMKIGSFKHIKYTPSETTEKFVNNHVYGGLFNRVGSNYWAISLGDPEGNPVYGMYRNGTWIWDRIVIGTEVDALNSRTNYKVIQTQLTLPSSVSIDAGSLETVFSNADLRTYTVAALDKPLTSGTLKAASYLWSNSAICAATDILVQNGKLTMALRNIAPESVTITAVRLLLIYEL